MRIAQPNIGGVCSWQLPAVFDGENNHSVIGVESHHSNVQIGSLFYFQSFVHRAPLSSSEACIGDANNYEASREPINWLPTLPKALGNFFGYRSVVLRGPQ